MSSASSSGDPCQGRRSGPPVPRPVCRCRGSPPGQDPAPAPPPGRRSACGAPPPATCPLLQARRKPRGRKAREVRTGALGPARRKARRVVPCVEVAAVPVRLEAPVDEPPDERGRRIVPQPQGVPGITHPSAPLHLPAQARAAVPRRAAGPRAPLPASACGRLPDRVEPFAARRQKPGRAEGRADGRTIARLRLRRGGGCELARHRHRPRLWQALYDDPWQPGEWSAAHRPRAAVPPPQRQGSQACPAARAAGGRQEAGRSRRIGGARRAHIADEPGHEGPAGRRRCRRAAHSPLPVIASYALTYRSVILADISGGIGGALGSRPAARSSSNRRL